MKKILLLSDTHGYLDDAILEHVKAADEVWHAGDIGTTDVCDTISKYKPLKGVYGNIDDHVIRKIFPLTNVFECEGLRVSMIHIGGYPGRYAAAVKEFIQQTKPQLFICGHSHILRVMRDPQLNLLHMNPGAAGIHGFHKIRTMIRFKVESGTIKDVEAIELGLRGSLTESVGRAN
jgi:putative phosphoesterase